MPLASRCARLQWRLPAVTHGAKSAPRAGRLQPLAHPSDLRPGSPMIWAASTLCSTSPGCCRPALHGESRTLLGTGQPAHRPGPGLVGDTAKSLKTAPEPSDRTPITPATVIAPVSIRLIIWIQPMCPRASRLHSSRVRLNPARVSARASETATEKGRNRFGRRPAGCPHRPGPPLHRWGVAPNVLSLRRLIIAESERFPDLARTYVEQAPSRGIDVIADAALPGQADERSARIAGHSRLRAKVPGSGRSRRDQLLQAPVSL
jgi:hypothetical protein